MTLSRFLLTTSLSVLFAFSSQIHPLRAHSANEAVPRGDTGWQDRQKVLNQRAADAGTKAKVIFIGDSITQGWEGEGKETWSRYYTPRDAVNLGIGGDRTQHVLWRLDHGNIDGLNPKAAVVMIGTNNSNGEDNTPGQIADGVVAIVEKLRAKLPQTKILLVGIFPRGENYNAQRGKLLQINQVLKKSADEKDIFWVDFGDQFVDRNGLIPRELMPDYLHLTSKAYGIWAEAIEERLASIIGDSRVKPGTSASTSPVNGEWRWTMPGPGGDPVSGVLVLQAEGETITGKFSRGEDRWLPIEQGKLRGNEVSWKVKRDRPGGGVMVYEMMGKLVDGKITGTTKADVDGQASTAEWSAQRK